MGSKGLTGPRGGRYDDDAMNEARTQLAQILNDRGISIRQLARMLGTSERHVSDLVWGLRGERSRQKWGARIIQLLGLQMTPEELFQEVGDDVTLAGPRR
jgi:predicted transcriptional regulator